MSIESRRNFLGLTAAAAMANPRVLTEPARYPLFTAAGSHRELGRQHGEQARDHIARHLDVMCSGMRITRAALGRKAARFTPLFEQHCPHLLDEIRGLANGARVSVEEAMACSIRGELGHVKDEGCTAYAIGRGRTEAGQVLAGQNSDMDGNVPPMAYVLRLKPAGKPEILMWTFGGMIGYHGMNSEGVAHFANALGGGPAGRFAMPHYPVKRMILEGRTVANAVDLLRRVPLASNGNYVMCDGTGAILDVEATTAGPEIIGDNGAGFLAHTNHFVCSRYARPDNHAKSWKDSFPRMERMAGLIESRGNAVKLEDIKDFLRDHRGEPTAICRHNGESRTVASLIAEPARRRLHVAAGWPCKSEYVVYSM
ncbi:MAG: hypothetical protein FJW39_19295 [Acidobacteria bacterium]|nr:hypothetical protein [Acidobacteriota bacterium]